MMPPIRVRPILMLKRRKVFLMACRHRLPPWWVKVPLYAATWPTEEGRALRIELHRRYLRAQKKEGLKAANRMARREARVHAVEACERTVRWAIKALRLWGAFG